MEADLARWYQIDYRDRWRGGLSLRRLMVLIRHLPPTSALSEELSGGKAHWSVEAHLLDDLRLTLSGKKAKPHPQRPRAIKRGPSPERRKQLAAGKRRAAARRRAIEAGEIT